MLYNTTLTRPTGNLGAGVAQNFSLTTNATRGYVWNHPDSGQDIYGTWNKATATATDWDFILEPGAFEPVPNNMEIDQLTLFSAGALTNGTDFVIRLHP